jgi:CRP/FNR family transcriptional regulator, cyclic AMP receptor protein
MLESSVVAVISESYFFSGLPEKIIQEIAASAHLKIFEKDEIVFFEGEACSGLHILQAGTVKLYRQAPNGRELILKVLESGSSFNEVPVFDGGVNPVNVAAMKRSSIWIISPQAIQKLMSNHPEVARAIIAKLAGNLRSMIQMAEELAFFQVTHRLARLLKMQLEEFPERGEIIRLPQNELASRLGTVREVVARALRELERGGVLEIERRRIIVRDAKLLEDWALGPNL